MAIDVQWMNDFAVKIKRCPRCKQMSFCLIFVGESTGEIWECAESKCLYNPSSSRWSE